MYLGNSSCFDNTFMKMNANVFDRLTLAGLECDADYEVTEPMPNNLTQSTGNVMIIETEGMVYTNENCNSQYFILDCCLNSCGISVGYGEDGAPR